MIKVTITCYMCTCNYIRVCNCICICLCICICICVCTCIPLLLLHDSCHDIHNHYNRQPHGTAPWEHRLHLLGDIRGATAVALLVDVAAKTQAEKHQDYRRQQPGIQLSMLSQAQKRQNDRK